MKKNIFPVLERAVPVLIVFLLAAGTPGCDSQFQPEEPQQAPAEAKKGDKEPTTVLEKKPVVAEEITITSKAGRVIIAAPKAGTPIDHEAIRAEHRRDIRTVEATEMLEAAKSFENLEEFEYGEQIIRYQRVISRFPGTPQAKEAADRIAHVRMKERREW